MTAGMSDVTPYSEVLRTASLLGGTSLAVFSNDQELLGRTAPHTKRAVHLAHNQVDRLQGWSRRPHIRFSHVGEMAAYPSFTNALARQVRDLSDEPLTVVIYTRNRSPGSWTLT